MTLPERYAFLTSQPIAHRGLHGLEEGRPENSLPAFAAAIAAGFPIELDVHLSADGDLVVFHDHDLRRACGRSERVRELPTAALVDATLFHTTHTIPTLDQVLGQVSGRVPLLIEFKHGSPAGHVAGAASRLLRNYPGLYAVQSFDPAITRALSHALPDVPSGQLGGPLHGSQTSTANKLASRLLFTLAISKPAFVNYDLRALPSRWVTAVTQHLDLPLLAWTVRSPADKEKADALGVNYLFDAFGTAETPSGGARR